MDKDRRVKFDEAEYGKEEESEEDYPEYWKESEFGGFHTQLLRRRIEDRQDRRTFQKVFDSQTLDAVQSLAQKGLFDVLEHIISTGKEAHVFVARDTNGNKRAVKIFKKETSDFRRMGEYIHGDIRFRDVPHERRSLVLAWCRKEYKNLLIASRARLPVPLPLGFKENVLVMEFIGKGQEGYPRLKDTKPSKKELESYLLQITDFISGLYLAGLVHADLSEYNILVEPDFGRQAAEAGNKPGQGGRNLENGAEAHSRVVVIDFAQALLTRHPNARDFFERDVRNMANYFTKAGLATTYEEMYAAVKGKKDEMEKLGVTGKKK